MYVQYKRYSCKNVLAECPRNTLVTNLRSPVEIIRNLWLTEKIWGPQFQHRQEIFHEGILFLKTWETEEVFVYPKAIEKRRAGTCWYLHLVKTAVALELFSFMISDKLDNKNNKMYCFSPTVPNQRWWRHLRWTHHANEVSSHFIVYNVLSWNKVRHLKFCIFS